MPAEPTNTQDEVVYTIEQLNRDAAARRVRYAERFTYYTGGVTPAEHAARRQAARFRRWDIALGATCVAIACAGETVALFRPVPWWPLLALSIYVGLVGALLLVRAIQPAVSTPEIEDEVASL